MQIVGMTVHPQPDNGNSPVNADYHWTFGLQGLSFDTLQVMVHWIKKDLNNLKNGVGAAQYTI
jgi:hypothetical protein